MFSTGKTIKVEKKRLTNYYTMLDGILYSNTWPIEHKTRANGRVIIKGSCATHNFTPFKDKNRNTLAIGGMDAWKYESYWRDIETYEEFLKAFKKRFKRDYTKDTARFEMFKDRIRKKESLNHADGLYLFIRRDKWDQLSRKPIITIHSDGFIELEGKSTEFDGQPSIVYFNGLYYLYLRYNVKYKTRFIQYSTSEDLYKWSKFRHIEVNEYDYDFENYYTPCFFAYKNYILGIIPYFYSDEDNEDKNYCCLRFLKSTDGHNFTIEKEVMRDKSALLGHNKAPKNRIVPAQGVEYGNNTIVFYMHHNYLGIDKESDVTIRQHVIDIEDFENAFNI